jgi:hypothetical protein
LGQDIVTSIGSRTLRPSAKLYIEGALRFLGQGFSCGFLTIFLKVFGRTIAGYGGFDA